MRSSKLLFWRYKKSVWHTSIISENSRTSFSVSAVRKGFHVSAGYDALLISFFISLKCKVNTIAAVHLTDFMSLNWNLRSHNGKLGSIFQRYKFHHQFVNGFYVITVAAFWRVWIFSTIVLHSQFQPERCASYQRNNRTIPLDSKKSVTRTVSLGFTFVLSALINSRISNPHRRWS